MPGLIAKISTRADQPTGSPPTSIDGPTPDVSEIALKGLGTLQQTAADPQELIDAIVGFDNAPFSKRPFRIHVDPSADCAEVVNGVADRVRAKLLRRIGLADLLEPTLIP